jgi:hypothetical protein
MKSQEYCITIEGRVTFLISEDILWKLHEAMDRNLPILCNTVDGIPFFLEIKGQAKDTWMNNSKAFVLS